MPPENRVGRHDRRHLTQPSTSQPLPAHGEPTPFIISEPKAPPTQLTPEDSVFFDQIGQRRLLLMIQPADQAGEKKPRGRDVNHGGSLHHRLRFEPVRPFGQVVGHYGSGPVRLLRLIPSLHPDRSAKTRSARLFLTLFPREAREVNPKTSASL